jgi:hypothetical protein
MKPTGEPVVSHHPTSATSAHAHTLRQIDVSAEWKGLLITTR